MESMAPRVIGGSRSFPTANGGIHPNCEQALPGVAFSYMSTETILIIVLVVLLLGGGGFYWGRR